MYSHCTLEKTSPELSRIYGMVTIMVKLPHTKGQACYEHSHNYVTALHAFARMDEPAQGVHINTVLLPALIIMILHDLVFSWLSVTYSIWQVPLD